MAGDKSTKGDLSVMEASYEMNALSTPQNTSHPTSLAPLPSAQSSAAALQLTNPQEGANIQELPPVDRGLKAWTFCASSFVLETMVWGFGFRFVTCSTYKCDVR